MPSTDFVIAILEMVTESVPVVYRALAVHSMFKISTAPEQVISRLVSPILIGVESIVQKLASRLCRFIHNGIELPTIKWRSLINVLCTTRTL